MNARLRLKFPYGLKSVALVAVAALLLFPASRLFADGPTGEAPKKRKIAILEFQTVSEAGPSTVRGRIVSEKITTVAVKSGLFEVVERHLIQKILDENEFGKDGISGTTAQKIGALLGADAVLTGAVTEYKDQLSIDARLIEVATGTILMADEAYARNDLQSITDAAKTVFGKMVGVIAPTASAQAPQQSAPPPVQQQAPQTPAPQSASRAGLRYPDASLRPLAPAELYGLSKAELKLMRNEIYARHGYIFQTEDMRVYFSQQPWYAPRSRAVEQFFNPIEQANVLLIKNIEAQKK